MRIAIDITDGHDLSNEARHGLLPKESKVRNPTLAIDFTVKGI